MWFLQAVVSFVKIDRVKPCITWEPENVMTFFVHFSPICIKLNATARFTAISCLIANFG